MSEIVVITTNLTPKEQRAYEAAVENNLPRIGPELQAKLFGLYLTGSSCEEIARLQPGVTLGQVVRCKVEYEWDNELNTYRTKLAENAREKLFQVQCEAFEFLSLMITATSQFYKDKIKKWMITRDDSVLEGLPITSMKQFKDNLEMLQKLTGSEVKKVEVNTNQTLTVKGAISPEKAAKLLELLEDGQDDDSE